MDDQFDHEEHHQQQRERDQQHNDLPNLLEQHRTAANTGAAAAAAAGDSNDSDSDTTIATAEAIRLTKLGSSIAISIALLWAVFLVLNFYTVFNLQPFARISRDWSPLQLSCFLGVEIGIFTIVALFISLIPAMIVTWTTAMLFDYACSRGLARRELLIQDGNQLAREIVLGTLKSSVRKGNLIALLVMVSCLLGAYFSPYVAELQDGSLSSG